MSTQTVTDSARITQSALEVRCTGYLASFAFFCPSPQAFSPSTSPNPVELVAVVVFGLNLTLAALMVAALTIYVIRGADLKSEAGPGELVWLERERWLFVVVISLSTTMSAFNPKIAVIVYLVVSALLITSPLWRQRRWGRALRHTP